MKPPLSGGAAPLVFTMAIRQSGTRSEWEVISHVPSTSVPPAKESLSNVASERSKVVERDSGRSRFDDAVIVTPGATRRIANYDCRQSQRLIAVLQIKTSLSMNQFEPPPSPLVRVQVRLVAGLDGMTEPNGPNVLNLSSVSCTGHLPTDG